ncbi:MAG: hypothetical protein ABH880_02230 [Patescibacteria group bacterium]
MAIIFSHKGKKAIKIDKSRFEKEDTLQQYIYENPESIPLYDIKEDIQLLILAREFPTNSGPIDAIGFDKDGSIYIVETKLYKNPDKRMVLAQMLDYGAALWRHSNDFNEFTSSLDKIVQDTFGVSLNEKLSTHFNLEEDALNQLLENVKSNLSDGVLRFVVLMDKLEDRLKDLILYVNQNSQFDIYAVELEYYKHDEYEIVIPKLYGAEVKKDISVRSSSPRKKWDEQSLLEDAHQRLDEDELTAFTKIYTFSKEHADKINYGSGIYGTFSPIFSRASKMSLFTLGTDKRLSFNFEWTASLNEELAELYKDKLESIGFSFPDNFKEIRPSVTSEEWLPKTDQFLEVIGELIR